MGSSFIFGLSLTASFLAGVLALFAPCCITFLFPSYLGTIFKERSKVALYTTIFALGLAFILVPVALGFRFFVVFLDAFHREIYYVGAFVLIAMGILTLKPLFHLPAFFHVSTKTNGHVSVGSVFSLGLMSGLTSACCAPVLFAAVTLTTLSPSLLQAVIVSFAYVLGIVFPLFILSLAYERTTKFISGERRQKVYQVLKYVGAGIFIFSGIAIAVANYFGVIQMNQMEQYGVQIRMIVFYIARWFQNPILDVGTFILVIIIFYQLLTTNRHE